MAMRKNSFVRIEIFLDIVSPLIAKMPINHAQNTRVINDF